MTAIAPSLESTSWRSIKSAPVDGRPVWVRRVHEGRVVAEGFARWSSLAAAAPARSPIWTPPWQAPLEESQADRDAFADTARWVCDDRLYLFPEPTEWDPQRTPEG
ncbi:MAG: hypothetical protein P4L73_20720 [Caulobacteraceae bacterium]|nr:hypothetical protein [Caulobacteraceae bacterium]